LFFSAVVQLSRFWHGKKWTKPEICIFWLNRKKSNYIIIFAIKISVAKLHYAVMLCVFFMIYSCRSSHKFCHSISNKHSERKNEAMHIFMFVISCYTRRQATGIISQQSLNILEWREHIFFRICCTESLFAFFLNTNLSTSGQLGEILKTIYETIFWLWISA